MIDKKKAFIKVSKDGKEKTYYINPEYYENDPASDKIKIAIEKNNREVEVKYIDKVDIVDIDFVDVDETRDDITNPLAGW